MDNPVFLIKVDEIPKSGLELSIPIEPEWFTTYLPLAYRIVEGRMGRLVGSVLRDADNVQVDLKMTCRVAFDCSRCAEDVEQDTEIRLEAVFSPDAGGDVNLAAIENLSARALKEMLPYENKTVDLEPVLGQHLAMSLSPYPWCKDDCAGLCARCGSNLNVEACKCENKPVDPRWEKLAQLRDTIKVKQ